MDQCWSMSTALLGVLSTTSSHRLEDEPGGCNLSLSALANGVWLSREAAGAFSAAYGECGASGSRMHRLE